VLEFLELLDVAIKAAVAVLAVGGAATVVVAAASWVKVLERVGKF